MLSLGKDLYSQGALVVECHALATMTPSWGASLMVQIELLEPKIPTINVMHGLDSNWKNKNK